MPSTFVGLLLFVLLSTPGLLHVLITEQGARPGRQLSAFRETITVGVTSVFANAAAVLVFFVARALFPEQTPDLARLIRESREYWLEDYRFLLLWAVSLFVLACLIAVLAGGWRNRVSAHQTKSQTHKDRGPIARWFLPPQGVEHVSGWWKLIYNDKQLTRAKRVSCLLDDGTRVEGWYYSFSHESNEGPDRDLLLSGPLVIRDADGSVRSEDRGAVCISARNIVLMHVSYEEPPVAAPSKPGVSLAE